MLSHVEIAHEKWFMAFEKKNVCGTQVCTSVGHYCTRWWNNKRMFYKLFPLFRLTASVPRKHQVALKTKDE